MYKQLYPHLFQPLRIKGLTLRNRIMSAPNMLFHTVDGRPTQYYISYLEHKARGGAGIVTLGEIPVCDGGCHTPGTELTNDNLPIFAEMAQAIKEHGAAASVELTHGGRNARGQFNRRQPMGPDDWVNPMTGQQVRAMTRQDMEDVADAFANAAEFWYHAGFDTVLIHMAHGWIFDQFLSPLSNHRTDEFGGSLENRMRFPLMVLRRIREHVGPDKVVQLRLSGSERDPNGFSVDDIIEFLSRADEYADMAEISVEGITNFFACTFVKWGQNVDLSEAIKRSGRVKMPVFILGSILDPAQAEDIIASGKADGVSMSRALIADPYLPTKSAMGRADDITPCLRCLNCTDSDNVDRHFVCSVNPLIGREARRGFMEDIGKAPHSRRVLVVGGGVAGMEAAVIAARRGHQVTLCEKSSALGGHLKFTDGDSLKKDLRRFKDYMLRKTAEENIRVLLNREANDELIEAVMPDAIIVATGSEPVTPGIPGIDNARHALSVYYRPESVTEEDIVMIGGGLVGVETALHLTSLGHKVTVLEREDRVMRDAGPVYGIGVMAKAVEAGINIVTGARVTSVEAGRVLYETAEGEKAAHGQVFYAVGMRSVDGPYMELSGKAPFVFRAGDCVKPGRVGNAMHSAFFAAMDVGGF